MKISFLTISCLTSILAISSVQSQAEPLPIKYKVSALEFPGDKKTSKGISIQKIQIESVTGMNQKSIKNMNSGLVLMFKSFERDARKCGSAAQGHPWNYESKFEKALASGGYVSLVFAKSTVCAGSPDIERESKVFSVKNGGVIPAMSLIKDVLPSAKILPGVSKERDLVRLDEETAETMIDDSKIAFNSYDDRCEFFLKNTSYRVWVDGKNLVLFPEFVQPNSFCQKEYVIKLAK